MLITFIVGAVMVILGILGMNAGTHHTSGDPMFAFLSLVFAVIGAITAIVGAIGLIAQIAT